MNDWLIKIIIIGLASGLFSVTVAQSKIFGPLREWTKTKSVWVGELISCPFCLGHWSTYALIVYNNWYDVGL